MKALTLFLAVAALTVSIYNAWQAASLRNEMKAFKNEIRAEVSKMKAEAKKVPNRQDLLAEARNHAQKAAELLKRGNIEAAREALALGEKALKQAGNPGSLGGVDLTSAFDSAKREVTKIWNEFAEQGLKGTRENAKSR